MRRLLALLIVPLLAATLCAGVLYALDRRASYRSPVAGPEAGWTPRERALQELALWRKEQAEAAAQRAELLRTLDTTKMVQLGGEIVHGRGLCFNCHSIGSIGGGTQGPNLEGIGARAGSRVPGLTDVEYLAQSLYQPAAFLVPGYPAAMVPANQPPIGLDDLEILMVIAYLQSLGGTPTVNPDTTISYAHATTAASR
ncbi:MAG: c-type cytochrome [Acidobacteriota bacterium]